MCCMYVMQVFDVCIYDTLRYVCTFVKYVSYVCMVLVCACCEFYASLRYVCMLFSFQHCMYACYVCYVCAYVMHVCCVCMLCVYVGMICFEVLCKYVMCVG